MITAFPRPTHVSSLQGSGPCGGLRLLEEVPSALRVVSQQADSTVANLILASAAIVLKSQLNLLCREGRLSPSSVTSHFLGTLLYTGVNFIIDH